MCRTAKSISLARTTTRDHGVPGNDHLPQNCQRFPGAPDARQRPASHARVCGQLPPTAKKARRDREADGGDGGRSRTILASCVLAGLLLLSPALADSAQRTLQLELSYPGQVSSFKLYKNGRVVCTPTAPSPTASPAMETDPSYRLSCPVEVDTTPMTFALTAVDSQGGESPQSPPYILLPPPVAVISSTLVNSGSATVAFDAGLSTSPYSTISEYRWDFGDGSTATGRQVTHTYPKNGDFTVALTVTNTHGGSTLDRLLVSIVEGNTAPVATYQMLQTKSGQLISGRLTARDANNDTLTYALVRLPTQGSVTVNPLTGIFTYRSTATFVGKDSFSFKANDGKAESNIATVWISVVSGP